MSLGQVWDGCSLGMFRLCLSFPEATAQEIQVPPWHCIVCHRNCGSLWAEEGAGHFGEVLWHLLLGRIFHPLRQWRVSESCVSQAGKNPVDFPSLAEQRVQEGPGEGTDRGCKRGLEGSAEEGLKPQEYST